MSRLEDNGLTRRDFLRVSGLAVGLGLTELQASNVPTTSAKACIQLFLVGGPSQLDTWDPKPAAPADVRGPFRPIRTNVPGISICEHFPRMARRADRFAVLRSVYHREAPIHETGQQLLQTGRLCTPGVEWPHFGAVLSKSRPSPARVPSWVLLPAIRGLYTGVDLSNGQNAGLLGDHYEALPAHLDPMQMGRYQSYEEGIAAAEREVLSASDPFERKMETIRRRVSVLGEYLILPKISPAFNLSEERESVRQRYGLNTFGQNCLLARRLIEAGVRTVTVNMFETVFGQVTWDCHANGSDLPATLDDYRDTLCPMLDQAYTALLYDLEALGLLETTLVLCGGEFGRTPRVNCGNGRDHWPGVWSMLLAGGGVRGGQVIGASDRTASEPWDRPIHASEIAATVYHALGVDPRAYVDAEPVRELF